MLLDLDGTQTLVRATHLARLPGGLARVMRGRRQVTYLHLIFETHQVVLANGRASESVLAGPRALAALEPAVRTEVLSLFPGLRTQSCRPGPAFPPARLYSRSHALPDCQRGFAVARF